MLNIEGYTFIRKDRRKRGGGIGMYIKNNITFSIIPTSDHIEQLWIETKQNRIEWGVGCLYKPPSASSSNFIDLLETEVVTSVNVISDHELVSCTLCTNNLSTPVVRRYRDYGNLDIASLTSELKSIPWRVFYDLENIDAKIDFFNCAILTLQYRHAAPIITRTFYKPHKPWMTENIKFLISLQHAALTIFKKVDSKQLRNNTTSALRQERRRFWSKKLKAADAMFGKTLEI
nr:unnamed protein product [Callosobruchus chinensis]